jgi:hypothetical protein
VPRVKPLHKSTEVAYQRASVKVRNHAVRQALLEFGFYPVDVFRARYWIRRGKPAGYRRDE